VGGEPARSGAGFPEERFLRDLLRAWDAAQRDAAGESALAAPAAFDWDHFLALVRRHGVAYPARAGLSRIGEGAVPPDVARALDQILVQVRSTNVLMFDRLRRVAARLEAAEVPFLVLKGPALVGLLYRDPAARPMTDLDLLIRRSDLSRALAALEEGGLEVPSGGERRFWERSYHHIVVRMGRDLPVQIELHWDLELRERYPFPLAEIWARSTSFPLGDARLKTLALDDHYLFGAIHLARHFYAPRLVWLVDQRRMAREWSLDWGAIAGRAAAVRARTPLWFVASYEERVFGDSALPPAVRPLPRPLQRRLLQWASGPRPLEPLRDVERESRRIFVTLLFFDRLTDLARFLFVHWRRKAAKWTGLERLMRSRE